MIKNNAFLEFLKKSMGDKIIPFGKADCGQRFSVLKYQFDPRCPEDNEYIELENSTFVKADPFDLHCKNPPLVKMCPFNAFTISGQMSGLGACFEDSDEIILLDPL